MNRSFSLAILMALMMVGSSALSAASFRDALRDMQAEAGSCRYYAYVSYGPAMVHGNLDEKENAYYNSGLRKYASNNFRAVFTSYNQTTLANGFTIETIGPFDTEAVAYQAMTSFVNDLRDQGYVEKTMRHTFPGVILRNANTRCN